MGVLDRARSALAGLAAWFSGTGRPDFVCGDCERWQRCGLPPNDKCLQRAAQIERDGVAPARRTAIIASGAGWIYERR